MDFDRVGIRGRGTDHLKVVSVRLEKARRRLSFRGNLLQKLYSYLGQIVRKPKIFFENRYYSLKISRKNASLVENVKTTPLFSAD